MSHRCGRLSVLLVIFIGIACLSGCTIILQKGRRSDIEEIARLKGRLNSLQRAKGELEERLQKEIAAQEVSVKMGQRGLVITFVAEVLFDSGKAVLRPGSFEKLDKIIGVLKTTVKDMAVAIEGHTDDVPIKVSGWKSNWELSTARALSVLHYLMDQDVPGDQLSATGYGEFRPITDNATVAGRQENRRVEIVIVPKRSPAGQ